MPEVSTITRSKPAALAAAITPGSAALISLPASRVASERMKTRGPPGASAPVPGLCQGPIAFMRMRSPSSAPPLLRRDGSMLMTAMCSASPWSSRRRRISSSVRLDLPAPPVPVMPSTGTAAARASSCSAAFSASEAVPFSSAVISCASARQAASPCPWIADRSCGACAVRSWSQRITISPIIPASPMRWPSSGVKMRTPCSASSRISAGTITPPPPPKTWILSPPRAFSNSTMYLKYSTWPPW